MYVSTLLTQIHGNTDTFEIPTRIYFKAMARPPHQIIKFPPLYPVRGWWRHRSWAAKGCDVTMRYQYIHILGGGVFRGLQGILFFFNQKKRERERM